MLIAFKKVFPLVFALLLICVMIGLGRWQLDRAELKRDKITLFERASSPQRINTSAAQELGRYYQVIVDGQYVSDKQVIMDGFAENKVAGYYVLTPFKLAHSDRIIMVNRGWRPWQTRRQEVDDLAVNQDSRQIRGRLDKYWQAGLVLGAGNSAEQNRWPRLSVYPQADEIATWQGTAIEPWQLLLAADETDGYTRKWMPGGITPQRHIGYAIQWFTMAFVLFILVAFSLMRQNNEPLE